MSAAFTPELLDRRLGELDAGAQAPLLCAVSGGADSLALAHALHCLGRSFRIVHVDHQLCPDSADWARIVERLARDWGVSCTVARVEIDGDTNVEARARAARYCVFEDVGQAGECLLTAHHLEDQALTVLLQLLRGAGPTGLAAMPARSVRGELVHLRPLLEVSESALADYCQANDLAPVFDPGNEDSRFDRNYLAREVAPRLAGRWPAYARTLARSAAHCAEADALLCDLARHDAGDLLSDALDLRALVSGEERRVRNALRAWLRERQLDLPPTARLGEFARQVMAAGADSAPRLDLATRVLRVHRAVVYETRDLPTRRDWRGALKVGEPLTLPGAAGTLKWSGAAPDSGRLDVRFRRGGERFGRAPSRSLKTFLHGRDVLPWRRGEVPLVFDGEELLAVGDWWQCDQFDGRLTWRPAARFRALGRPSLRKSDSAT